MTSPVRKRDREEQIVKELLRRGKVAVEELAEKFETAPANIRRDLNNLVRRGLVLRTRGGAVAIETPLYERFRYDATYENRKQHRVDEKRRIAHAAAEFIREGEMIGFTAGTTTTQVARNIRHRQNIKVVTNAVNIAMELCDCSGLETFVTGGLVRWTGSFSLVGEQTVEFLSKMFVDKAYISVSAVDAFRGATTIEPFEATTFRAMVSNAKEVIVVADSSKLGKVTAGLVCPTSGIHKLITDTDATDEAVAEFERQGVEVIRV
jgi:DeoR family transcriptional regulator, aga operon transcriptional repressor